MRRILLVVLAFDLAVGATFFWVGYISGYKAHQRRMAAAGTSSYYTEPRPILGHAGPVWVHGDTADSIEWH